MKWKEGKYLKKEKMFLQRRMLTEKEGEKYWGEGYTFFVGEKKNEKGKGGKYSEMEKISFFVRRRRTEKEKRKIFGERKYVSVEEKKNGDELQGSKKGGE